MREYSNFQPETKPRRELLYTQEFKQLIREHPGSLKTVIHSMNVLSENQEPNKTVTENGVSVTLQRIKYHGMELYDVEVGGERLFVKRLPRDASFQQGGPLEYQHTGRITEIVKDIPWAEVVSQQVAYSDNKYNYFVSKWNNHALLSVDQYIRRLSDQIHENQGDVEALKQERFNVYNKIDILRGRLGDMVRDWHPQDMGYDPQTEHVILFDLNPFKDAIS